MELRRGYKKTEYGPIPKEWGILPLDMLIAEMTDYVAAGSFESLKNNVKVYNNVNYAMYVRLYDLRLGLGHSKQKYLDESSYIFLSKSNLFGNEILMANIGANVGETVLMPKLNQPATIAPNMILIRANNSKVQFSYLYHYSKSNFGKQRLFELIAGSGHPKINKTDLKKWLVLVPALPEQTAIAKGLSDADAWIQSLTRLIAKKRQIKQGAMQTLLNPYENGKLKEDWNMKSIFDLADQKKELFDDGDWIEAEHITEHGVRLIQTGNIGINKFIDKGIKKYIYEESYQQLHCKQLRAGDLLICRLAEPAGRACIFPAIEDEQAITSVDVTIFRPRKEIADRVYLSNLFSTSEWFKKVNENVGGTTHQRISRGALGRIEVALPPLQQQSMFAEIFSDMDNEITELEIKLNKAKKIKQGMMQNLLTGRIRLI